MLIVFKNLWTFKIDNKFYYCFLILVKMGFGGLETPYKSVTKYKTLNVYKFYYCYFLVNGLYIKY